MKNNTSQVIHKEFQDNHLVEIRDTATQRSLYFDNRHLQSAMSFDYSQHVIDIARGYFRLPETGNIRVICADGDDFIKRPNSGKKYDMILVDAFDGQGMAPSIYTESFFKSVR